MHLLAIATWAPSAAKAIDMALPKPVPPPVTNAIFPLRASFGSIRDLIGGNFTFGSLQPAILFVFKKSKDRKRGESPKQGRDR